jgi:hypothetical protein
VRHIDRLLIFKYINDVCSYETISGKLLTTMYHVLDPDPSKRLTHWKAHLIYLEDSGMISLGCYTVNRLIYNHFDKSATWDSFDIEYPLLTLAIKDDNLDALYYTGSNEMFSIQNNAKIKVCVCSYYYYNFEYFGDIGAFVCSGDNTKPLTFYKRDGTQVNLNLNLDGDSCSMMNHNNLDNTLIGAGMTKVKAWKIKYAPNTYEKSYELQFTRALTGMVQMPVYLDSFVFSTKSGFLVSTTSTSYIYVMDNPCHPTCSTCSGLAINECLTCPDGLPPTSGYCCAEGTFFDGSVCQNCPRKCAACQSLVSCTKCRNLKFIT